MKTRELTVYPVLNGWMVKVGCQLLAYTDAVKLAKDFGDYLKDPEATEKRIVECDGVNRKATLPEGLNRVQQEYAREQIGQVMQSPLAESISNGALGVLR